MMLILITQGAYIAMVYDTSPYVSVTFKQPEGALYPGPYPKEYIGTAPFRGTPRGLENAHLSPNSWCHVAVTWLITLIPIGPKILVEELRKPCLMYMFLVTIPAAPMFNMIGRYLGWWGPPFKAAPGGIGALFYEGALIKGFNIITLFLLGVTLLYILSRERTEGKA